MNYSVFRRFHVVPILLLISCGALLSWPLWWLGFPPQTDDAKCHVTWFIHFFAQFSAGEIYPRWLPNMNAGLGSPAFFYYPPLSSWFTSVLNLLWPTSDAWLAVGRSASVAWVASGLAMYAWLQTFSPRRWALVAALVFLAGPYRATADIYLRGALAEHWAFVWLPLMLWATQNLMVSHENRVRSWCLLSLLFALLLLTHPPTAIIFAPVVLAFAVFTTSSRSWQNVCWALAAMGFGAFLSAIYLLPALGTEQFVWMEEMRTGAFFYERAFLTLRSSLGDLRLHSFSLTSLLLVGVFCFATVRASNAIEHRKNDQAALRSWRRARFWFAVALIAAFMTTVLSAPLYAIFSPLARIQFPYRWIGVVSLAVAPLLAEALTTWSQQRNEYSKLRWKIVGAACGFIALLWIPVQILKITKAYPQFKRNEKLMSYVDWYVRNGAEMPGHRPRDAQTLNTDTPALYRKIGLKSPNYAFAEIVRGQGSVRVRGRSPRHIELEVTHQNAQSLMIRVRQFNFGAWRAISGEQPLRVSSSVPDGLILIGVPANTNRITLEMPLTTSETWGKNLSFSALIIWMILMSSTWIQRSKPQHRVLDV